MGLLIRLSVVILFFGYCLYSYIDKNNELSSLRIKVPRLVKQIDGIKEENKRLYYEIEQFENPVHLLELAKNPQFSHLKYPFFEDILEVEAVALKEEQKEIGRDIKEHTLPMAFKAK